MPLLAGKKAVRSNQHADAALFADLSRFCGGKGGKPGPCATGGGGGGGKAAPAKIAVRPTRFGKTTIHTALVNPTKGAGATANAAFHRKMSGHHLRMEEHYRKTGNLAKAKAHAAAGAHHDTAESLHVHQNNPKEQLRIARQGAIHPSVRYKIPEMQAGARTGGHHHFSDASLFAELSRFCGSPSRRHDDAALFTELHRFCQEGENKGKPGVCPQSGGAANQPTEGGAAKAAKPKAERGEMAGAKREGKGKEAKIILADGSPAPAHITPAMVPPEWSDVKISTDPKADVLVQARDKKGNAKTVYSDNWNMKAAAAKFSRIHDALHEMPGMTDQVQRDRADPKKAGVADATWLMQEQGTRPGSEADNKGVSKLFGHKLAADDVTVGAADKNGAPKVTLKIDGKDVPVKDKKARAEIARRKEAGEPLHDSTFWLKSHGATTLEGRHIVEAKDGVRLQFMGKESVWHDHLVRDPKLSAMLLERKKAAGDTGKLFGVSDGQVSTYAKTLDHGGFSPKDWRTARATRLAIEEINKMEPPKSAKDYKAAAMTVAKKVSGVLGNEPAQALTSYISPIVFSNWRAAVA